MSETQPHTSNRTNTARLDSLTPHLAVSFPPMPSRLASLLTLFRLAQPELFEYFEDEQVPYIQVAMSWVRTLLSKEMWLGDVLRLWGEARPILLAFRRLRLIGEITTDGRDNDSPDLLLTSKQTHISPQTTPLSSTATSALRCCPLAKSPSRA